MPVSDKLPQDKQADGDSELGFYRRVTGKGSCYQLADSVQCPPGLFWLYQDSSGFDTCSCIASSPVLIQAPCSMYASMWNFRLKSWPMGQRATISTSSYAVFKQQLSLSLWYVNPERVLVKQLTLFFLEIYSSTWATDKAYLITHTQTHSTCVYHSKTLITVAVWCLSLLQYTHCFITFVVLTTLEINSTSLLSFSQCISLLW